MKHTLSILCIASLLTSSLYAGDFPQSKQVQDPKNFPQLMPLGWTLVNTAWDAEVPPTIGQDQSDTQSDTKIEITNPFPPMMHPTAWLLRKSSVHVWIIKSLIHEDLPRVSDFATAQKNPEFITKLKAIYAQRAIAATYIPDETTFADEYEDAKADRRKQRNRNLRKNSYHKKLHTETNVPHAIYNDPKSENRTEKVHEKKNLNNLPQYRLPKKEIYGNNTISKGQQTEIITHAHQSHAVYPSALALTVLTCHHFLQPAHKEQPDARLQRAQQLNQNSLGFIHKN